MTKVFYAKIVCTNNQTNRRFTIEKYCKDETKLNQYCQGTNGTTFQVLNRNELELTREEIERIERRNLMLT